MENIIAYCKDVNDNQYELLLGTKCEVCAYVCFSIGTVTSTFWTTGLSAPQPRFKVNFPRICFKLSLSDMPVSLSTPFSINFSPFVSTKVSKSCSRNANRRQYDCLNNTNKLSRVTDSNIKLNIVRYHFQS